MFDWYSAINKAAKKFAEAGWGDTTFNDACFIIETGAELVRDPKPQHRYLQKYRHLPHHVKDATSATDNESVDLPHLRNALARVSQVQPVKEDTDKFRSRAAAHLRRHARELLKSDRSGAAKAICDEFNITESED